MQKVIIGGGQVRYITLTPTEEKQRLQEIEQSKVEQSRQKKQVVKHQLVQTLLQLREMKQNRDVFTQEDINEKQGNIDRLKAEYQTLFI